MVPGLAQLATYSKIPNTLVDIGGYLRRAGQSLGIVIDTPRLSTQRPLDKQFDDVVEALQAGTRIQKWWNEDSDELRTALRQARTRSGIEAG